MKEVTTMSIRIDRAKLAAALVRADLNGNELAERSGVSRCTVTAVRTGKSCSKTTADKLASGLGIPVEELLEKHQNA